MKRVLTVSLLLALVMHTMGGFLLIQFAKTGAGNEVKDLILKAYAIEDMEEMPGHATQEKSSENEVPEKSNFQETTTLDNDPLNHPVVYGCMELYRRNSLASAPLAMASDVPTPPPDRFAA
jgi:hypothetical protein